MAANSKKRPAPSQAGPKQKKIHVEKPKKQIEEDSGKKVKRGRPVTLPQNSEPETSSEDEEDNEEAAEASEGEDEMQIDDAPAKDPNGTLSIGFFSTH